MADPVISLLSCLHVDKSSVAMVVGHVVGSISQLIHDHPTTNLSQLLNGSPELINKLQLLRRSLEHLDRTKCHDQQTVDLRHHILTTVCLPMTSLLLSEMEMDSWGSVITDVFELTIGCFCQVSNVTKSTTLDLFIDILDKQADDKKIHHLVVLCAIDSLAKILSLNDVSNWTIDKETIDRLSCVLTKLLTFSDDGFVGRILVVLIPSFLNACDKFHEEIGIKFWTVIKTHLCGTDTNSSEVHSFLLLCGLVDVFFPLSGFNTFSMQLIDDPFFWKCIQCGLCHVDSLTRKRSLYLLQRLVDASAMQNVDFAAISSDVPLSGSQVPFNSIECMRNLSNAWKEFLLLVETLEEKQTHVILPILQRFGNIVEHTKLGIAGPRLHTSWLLTLFRRMSTHEATLVRRWAVCNILTLDYSTVPVLQQDGGLQFLSGLFLKMLMEPTIYHRSPDDSAVNAIVSILVPFFVCVNKNLKNGANEKIFWNGLLATLSRENFDGAALVYVMCALVDVKCPEVVDNVDCLRSLLMHRVRTHHIVYRSSIQAAAVHVFTNLVSVAAVDIEGLARFIGCLRADEGFRRDASLWHHLVNWIKAESVRGDKRQFDVGLFAVRAVELWLNDTSECCDDKTQNTCDIPECLETVRLLLLVVDAGLLPGSCDLGVSRAVTQSLLPLADVLQSAGSHVYLSKIKVHRAMALLIGLVSELNSNTADAFSVCVRSLVEQSLESVLNYIARAVTSVLENHESDLCVSLYMSVMRSMVDCVDVDSMSRLSVVNKLLQLAIKHMSSDLLSQSISVELLCTLTTLTTPQSTLSKSLKDFLSCWSPVIERPSDSCRGFEWSTFLRNEWTLINWYLTKTTVVAPSSGTVPSSEWTSSYIDVAERTLDVAGPDALVACFNGLVVLLETPSNSSVSSDAVVRVLSCAWQKVKEFDRNSQFNIVYTSYINVAFHSTLLQHSTDSVVTAFQLQCFREILLMAEDKHGVLNQLVSRLCLHAQHHGTRDLTKLVPCLAESLLFGPTRTKTDRLFVEVVKHLETLSFYSPHSFYDNVDRDDSYVRVKLLHLLLTDAGSGDVTENQLGRHVTRQLVSIHRQSLSKPSRCYANSVAHRRSHRLLSSILLMENFLDSDPDAELSYVTEVLERETQPSVRLLAEWLFIRLVNRHQQLTNGVVELLRQANSKKAAFLCSLFVVTTHVGRLLSPAQQPLFISAVLPLLLPWCTVAHFNTRLFAQAAVHSLWRTAKQHRLETVLVNNSLIESLETFVENNRELCRALYQLLDNYCFLFDAVNDYSVETLLELLPRLTCVGDSERLTVDMFTVVAGDRSWNSAHVPLRGISDRLRHCTPEPWKLKQSGADSEPIGPVDTDGIVQKKLVPWRSLLPEVDHDDECKVRRAVGKLVVVTTLVDRMPNLGGLCRTCEIFGVDKFVIASLRYVEDKTFETLSVTAQKWMNIEEVRRDQLVLYLLDMKKQGYTVVGAEQTSSGHTLHGYQFPLNAVIVLGNEKSGIPAEFLQVIDVCVEIPQSGVVRSLNVHVSGALFVWEYYKQWILRTNIDL